jgi:type I restriction enzyme S subunit
MVDWPVEKLGDLVDANRGISYGIVQPGEHQPGGVPIIRVSDLKGDSVETGKPLRVAPSIEAAHSRTRLRGGELIMSIVGTVGQTAIVDSRLEGWNVARAVAVIPVKRDIGPYWIRLALKGGPARAHIQDRLNTTVQATLNLRDLASLPIVMPPAPEREAIAATLGALDDKIELNRKMNATLEAMARALFRDWFVDFGPTRAKMEGRTPYLSPDLWSLFPDRLDDEGKPEGWEEKPLDEVADFLNGLALQKFPGKGQADSLPVIKIAELRSGITANSNGAARKLPPQYIIQDGDFLFSWSGSLLAKFWTGGEGALNQHLFKVASHRYPAWFYSEWVQHHLEDFQVIAASKATTMGHIQRGHLRAAKTICPPDSVIARLGEIVAPLIDRIIRNELESRTLAQTRDLLLPRLMSGELRVAEAERIASEVA